MQEGFWGVFVWKCSMTQLIDTDERTYVLHPIQMQKCGNFKCKMHVGEPNVLLLLFSSHLLLDTIYMIFSLYTELRVTTQTDSNQAN